MLIREKQKFIFPSFFWPLLAYAALSLISCFLSVNPEMSLKDSRELLLFLIVPIVYTGFSEEKVLKKANLALLASAYLSCLYSLFYFFSKASPGERISGFMGQVMTQGGLLLLFSCMALSMLIFSRHRVRYLWGLGFFLSLVALILTQTRSAWIGLVIAASLILFLYKPKALIIVPLAVGLFYLASPQPIKKRALSSFSLKHPINKPRIEYMRAGIKIIGDFPLFGTGPNTVEMVFQNPKYGLSEVAKNNVHLHNNILQTGAERGIPTLLAWLTFMVWIFISLFRLLKNKDPTLYPFTIAALAALLALFTAGLFEYNFADSEITALFLYMITIPFSLARIQEKGVNV
jgi:O-antigen ligase